MDRASDCKENRPVAGGSLTTARLSGPEWVDYVDYLLMRETGTAAGDYAAQRNAATDLLFGHG